MGLTIKHELFSGGINRTNTESTLACNTANIYKLYSFVFKYAPPHRISPSSDGMTLTLYMYKSANVDITISLVSNVKLHVFFIFPLAVINETHTYAVSGSSL